MRTTDLQYDAVELLPTDADSIRHQKTAPLSAPVCQDDAIGAFRVRHVPIIKQVVYLLPLLLSLIPVGLLLGFSPNLTKALSKSACTPGGEFVMPYTLNVWNTTLFFEITAPITGTSEKACGSTTNPLDSEGCYGYSFTKVKVIDLAWDVLVGRGGQVILVFLAYKVFGRVVTALMEQGEVGYDVFASLAFGTGTFPSCLPLARHAVGRVPVPQTRRATWSYVGMLLATVYIVAMPSLLSAMTGYTAVFTPTIRVANELGSNGTLMDCYPALIPVWGLMDVSRFYIQEDKTPGIYKIAGSNTSMVTYEWGSMWIDYYHRYQSVYDECSGGLDISSCKAAQQESTVTVHYFAEPQDWQVSSPMPGIVPYHNITDTTTGAASQYRYWQCGFDELIDSRQLIQSPNYVNPYSQSAEQDLGLCQADKQYVWGFSFLLSLLVAVLHVSFTALMYALWFSGRSRQDPHARPAASGFFHDAVNMVTQAQKQYGMQLEEWSPASLRKEVLNGQFGMTYLDDAGLRRRKTEQSQRLTEGRGGDWGGDVVTDERGR